MGETAYYTIYINQTKHKVRQNIYKSYLIVESYPPTGHFFCRFTDISPIHIIIFRQKSCQFSWCRRWCRNMSGSVRLRRLAYSITVFSIELIHYAREKNRAHNFIVIVVDESHSDQILLIFFFFERRILQVINERR